MGRGQHLKASDVEHIKSELESGVPPKQIVVSTGWPKSTVYKIAKKLQTAAPVLKRRASAILTPEGIERGRTFVSDSDGQISVRQVQSQLGIARSTARRLLRERLSFKALKKRKCQKLTERHRVQRLAFARRSLLRLKMGGRHADVC